MKYIQGALGSADEPVASDSTSGAQGRTGKRWHMEGWN